MHTGRDVVVVFARAPVPGAVKTRLARDVGDERALSLYTWLGARVVRAIASPDARRYDVEIAYTPDAPLSRAMLHAWLPWADRYEPQGEGDLGARMERAIARHVALGRRVVVIGTDCADLDAARIDTAFTALESTPCVLGPARDGGYYLVGASRPLPIFHAMPWSTSTVLAETLARLGEANLASTLLVPAVDIDTVDDLASIAPLADVPAWVRTVTSPAKRG